MLSVGGSGADEGSKAAGITSQMFGQTFYYDAYAPPIARQLLEQAGFEIERWEIDASSLGHIAVIAKKTA